MIEISHKQAQYLIRQSADKRLPEEQWAALQAHLERCPACRGYRDRLAVLDRSLRRTLLARWRPAEPSVEGLARTVMAYRRQRGENRRSALYGLFGLIAAGLIVLFSLPNWVPALRGGGPRQAAVATATATPEPLPTLTPTPSVRFQGLVAYASRATGDSEIYLLNATPKQREQTNLTNNPAEDTFPVWSRDGEWLAFLSDRSGKQEIYLVNVAGTGLVQLTDAPGIYWQGPLSWSGDGRWIALTGKRLDQNADAYTYLVPLDGSDPVSLPGSQGLVNAPGLPTALPLPPLFSPRISMLASLGPGGTVQGAQTEAGWTRPFMSAQSLDLRGSEPPVYPYDWGTGGDTLLYVDARTGEIRRQTVIDPQQPGTNGDVPVVEAPRDGARFRSVTMRPDGPALATLQEEANNDCWTVRVFFLYLYDTLPERSVPGLCVLADLQPVNWTSGGTSMPGSWLVVSAQENPDGPAGLYAVFVPGLPREEPAVLFERLADLPTGEALIPQVRPLRGSLSIQPRPAGAQRRADGDRRKPAAPPAELTGSLLVLEEDGAISTLSPNGLQRKELLSLGSTNTCPSWSPDRSKVVFLSDRGSDPSRMVVEGVQQTGPSEIFVLDAASGAVNQLTDAMLTGRAAMGLMQGYSCPSWSPDGKYLAVASFVGRGSGLMVMTPDGQVVRYGPIDLPSAFSNLLWTPDGQAIVLAEPRLRGNAPRIVLSRWREPVAPRTLLILDGWDDVHGLSLSPDGKQLAFILYREPTSDAPGEARLRVVSMTGMKTAFEKTLPGYDARSLHGPGRIAWLADGQLLFAIPQNPLEQHKALLARYDPTADSLHSLAASEDTLYDWALDGSWLIYSSESGLWGVPTAAEEAVPFRISPEPALRLDWR